MNYPPVRVSFAAKALWTEALLSKGLRHLQLEPLNSAEKRWMKDLLCPFNPTPKNVKKNLPLQIGKFQKAQKFSEIGGQSWIVIFFSLMGPPKGTQERQVLVGLFFIQGGTGRKILLGDLAGAPTIKRSG